MNKYQTAFLTLKAFKCLYEKTKTRMYKTQGKSAGKLALNLLGQLVARNTVLRSLGYETNDDGELIKYVVKSPTEEITLALKAATGDTEAAKEISKRLQGKT